MTEHITAIVIHAILLMAFWVLGYMTGAKAGFIKGLGTRIEVHHDLD